MELNKKNMLKLQAILWIDWNTSKIFYTVVFINTNITKKYTQDMSSPVNFLQPVGHIHLNLTVVLL